MKPLWMILLSSLVSCSKPAVGGCPGEGTVEDCSKACGCRSLGRCENVDGRCAPAKDEHCQQSRSCEMSGLCHVEGDRCVAKVQEDCDAAKMCKNEKCSVADGRCQVAKIVR